MKRTLKYKNPMHIKRRNKEKGQETALFIGGMADLGIKYIKNTGLFEYKTDENKKGENTKSAHRFDGRFFVNTSRAFRLYSRR